MIPWTPFQFGGVWDSFYESCNEETQETIDRRLDFLLEKGNQAREPISKHLSDGIFELRAKDARFLYYFAPEKAIVFVHCIIKKRSDVPQGDIDLAKERRNLIQNEEMGGGNLHEITN